MRLLANLFGSYLRLRFNGEWRLRFNGEWNDEARTPIELPVS